MIAGFHAVQKAMEHNPDGLERIWLDKSRNDARIGKLHNQATEAHVRVQRVPKTKLDSLIGEGVSHQGVIARYRVVPVYTESDLSGLLKKIKEQALLLVLDGIQDPHNLGACLRNAAAFAVDGVIVPKSRSAPLTATVRKAASGGAEIVPVFQVNNLARAIETVKESGIWVMGATSEDETRIFDADLTGPVALVIGSEGKGLRHRTRELCDTLVQIPVSRAIESLNASVATGICLFEVARQRHNITK